MEKYGEIRYIPIIFSSLHLSVWPKKVLILRFQCPIFNEWTLGSSTKQLRQARWWWKGIWSGFRTRKTNPRYFWKFPIRLMRLIMLIILHFRYSFPIIFSYLSKINTSTIFRSFIIDIQKDFVLIFLTNSTFFLLPGT